MIGILKQISQDKYEELIKSREALERFLYEDKLFHSYSLGTAWSGLHFLLTGREFGGEPPLANVLLGGQQMTESPLYDVGGNGFPVWLAPDEVKVVANAVSVVTAKELRANFDRKKFIKARVYPDGWNREDEEPKRILGYWKGIVEFYKDTALKSLGRVFWVN